MRNMTADNITYIEMTLLHYITQDYEEQNYEMMGEDMQALGEICLMRKEIEQLVF